MYGWADGYLYIDTSAQTILRLPCGIHGRELGTVDWLAPRSRWSFQSNSRLNRFGVFIGRFVHHYIQTRRLLAMAHCC